MANKKKCFHLGFLFMFMTLAVGSRNLESDLEGFPTTVGSKLLSLREAQKNNSVNPSDSSNEGGNLGFGGSQNKRGEGDGLAKKGEAENGTEVSIPRSNNNNNTVGVIAKDDRSNVSSSGNLPKGSKPDRVKHGRSQKGNANSTGNGVPSRKDRSKTSKNDDLGTKKNETEQNLGHPQQNLVPSVDSKGSEDETQKNDMVTYPPPKKDIEPPPVEGHNENSNDTRTAKEQEKSGSKSNKDASSRDSTNGSGCDEAHSCTDKKNIFVACFRVSGNEMQELSLLILNKGEETLHVSINAPDFLKIDPLNSTLEKQKSKSVQVSMANSVPRNASLSKIVINGGDGECILDVPNQYVNLSYKQRFFDGFSYSAIVTPMFGVYLLIFTVLAIGGSWMCCKLRGKRQHGDGIKYQELEMNHPESNLSANGGKLEADSIDGWDEWDDTWEDAEAGRSSTRPIQTVSSNGLASRRSNKDGWDNSWDD